MSISTSFFPKTDHHFFYDYLLVMTEDQIKKLRRIMIGIEKITSFSDNEIEELQKKVSADKKVASEA